jgi:hypothetical protein
MSDLDKNWRDNLQIICEDLAKGKCILLLGPELPFLDSGSRYESLKAFLEDKSYKNEVDIQEDDDLMSFKNLSRKDNALFFSALKEYFLAREASDIYRQIAELPFQTIISMSPDHLLKGVFEEKREKVPAKKQHYNYRQADYNFSRPDPDFEKLNKPSPTEPLIFNLMGRADERDSLALDYEKFFDFLLAITGEGRLPKALLEELNNVETLIFLGFRLEKWYFKLLIRILGLHNKMAFSPKGELAKNMVTVYQNHFGFDFIDISPQQFISDVHARCKSLKKLREDFQPRSQREIFDELYRQNDLRVMFAYLMSCYDHQGSGDDYNTLSMALNNWEKKEEKYLATGQHREERDEARTNAMALMAGFRNKLKSDA